MEDLRNLVTGPNCEVDDGGPRTNFRNPLAKFADVMYRDRSQKEQQEFINNNNHVHMEMPHEPVLNTQMSRQVERFLDHFEPNTMDPLGPYAQLNVDEFDEFAHEQGRPQDPRFPVEAFNQMKISEEIPSELLKQYFKSLIHTAQTQEPFMPIDMCELPFNETDKLKIRNRTMNLARQIFTNQNEQFVEEQLSKFLDSFDSHHHHGREKHSFNHNSMVNEFLREHNEPIPEEHFDKYFNQAREAEAMAREFQDNQFREFDQYYHDAHNVDSWVDEFEGKRSMRPIQNLHDVTSSITNIQDPKLQQTNFVKFLTRLNKGELELVDNGVVEKTPEQRNVDNWANDFEQMRNDGRLESDINLDSTDMSPEAWFQEFQKFQGMNYPRPPDMEEFNEEEWLREFSVFGQQDYLKNYIFTPAEDNPYMAHPDPLNKGMELFHDGKISESILAFEAELQNNPQNSQAWQLLGQAQAESDKDTQAIAALLKAVETDPENRPARMALAVSYTNDLFRDEALECLRNWMESHPEYSHIKIQMPNFHMGYSFDAYHQAISEMFLEAARLRPENPDPDVQTALGLLYNLSVDYDKAVDCFKAALSVRPDDYLLWNKLGATLANSNRSDEAIGCYYRALKIKPSYVRARANLGISFMALKNFPKAAQYFLGALSLHPDAIHIWNNLQMVFMSMDREDLVDKAVQRDIELFRNEFEF